jgi:flagellar assembly protein FliH
VVEPAEAPPTEPVFVNDPALIAELERLRVDSAAMQDRVAEMAVTMARLRRDVLEASEPELVQLALSIAERVVGRELAADPGLLVGWAHEAVQALAAKDEVVIAIAKDVASRVPAQSWEAMGPDIRVLTDPALGLGAVEVRAPEAVVEAGARARLTSVALALGVSDE